MKKNKELNHDQASDSALCYNDNKYSILVRFKFETYQSPHGRCDVQKTIDEYDEYGALQLYREVSHLSITPKNEWDHPHAKKLVNEDPLYEIRYYADRRQTRAIGYFKGDTFVILAICTHKQHIYDPPGVFETCHKRIKRLTEGTATTVPLKMYGEPYPTNDR